LCNAALLKPDYQISLGSKDGQVYPAFLGSKDGQVYPAFLVNDGDRTNSIKAGSCITSVEVNPWLVVEVNPWFVVDLGVPMTIKFILLTNHAPGSCTLLYCAAFVRITA